MNNGEKEKGKRKKEKVLKTKACPELIEGTKYKRQNPKDKRYLEIEN